jgi:hypothetical protein
MDVLSKIFDINQLNTSEDDISLKELLHKRLEDLGLSLDPVYIETLDKEIRIIQEKQFSKLLLFLLELNTYLKGSKRNDLLNTGMGVMTGSLSSYIAGLSNLDPIKFGLLTDRLFLSQYLPIILSYNLANFDIEPIINIAEGYGYTLIRVYSNRGNSNIYPKYFITNKSEKDLLIDENDNPIYSLEELFSIDIKQSHFVSLLSNPMLFEANKMLEIFSNNFLYDIDLNNSQFISTLKTENRLSLLKVLKSRDSLNYLPDIKINSFHDLCLYLAIDFSTNYKTFDYLSNIHDIIFESELVYSTLKNSGFIPIFQEDILKLISFEDDFQTTYKLWRDCCKSKEGASDTARSNFIRNTTVGKPELAQTAKDYFDEILLGLMKYSVPKPHLYNIAYIFYVHTYLEQMVKH